MVQVKGHIAKMAICLEDSDPRIASLAHLFFEEMSRKTTKVPLPSLIANMSHVNMSL